LQKSNVSLRLAEVEKRLVDGGDEMIQLLDLCLHVNRVVHAQ
jgi:hypothetical protein